MPRENSFSDSDGRSLTPDMEDEPVRPTPASPTSPTSAHSHHSRSPAVKHTATTRATGITSRPTAGTTMDPKAKFRHTVRKVMAMHRGTNVLTGRGAGAEPGVDPRRASADAQFGGIKQDCVIEVADYSAIRSSFGRMTNREFVNFMNDPTASEREPWVKVRWINIGGMSWDVIKAVSIKYDLHPLALEDVFHTRSQTRSKADYYSKHLFLRILCHELGDPNESYGDSAASGSTLTDLPRSDSPTPFTDDDDDMELRELGKGDFGDDEKTLHGSNRKRRPLLPSSRSDLGSRSRLAQLETMRTEAADVNKRRRMEEAAIRALKSGDRVNVKVSPMFIFLFRDGTVISMHSTPNLELTQPITRRLRQRDTGLRTSADCSLLVQSLLDLIVDKALEVIDEYHVKIKKFEREILLKPKIGTVRNLHILSGDLILHKRTLEPIKTVIYGLRRYDVDRAAALVDSTAEGKDVKVVGFMSHKSKIYLADVFDHMEYILTSLEMFAGIGENLINYTFNMASYEMNEVMRRLTLATIIFLPLTLLTGYFGMNFDNMWTVHHGHSDLVFWIIALPLMAIVLPIFIVPDIKRMIHYFQKRILTKKVVKSFKTA
ncbi:hypothetical protein B0H10DRAFT_2067021 [Mycena sp. CBHHK59/15]|nr:hypothetical protein B0H10DRAFT_2067021 [Mycena sp. CBHHK59/15]